MNIFKRIFKNNPKSNPLAVYTKLNIEELLTSNDLNSSIISIDNYIGALGSWGDEMNKLTEPQKIFYYNQNLEREVNSGGFAQFFYNSSGNLAHQTLSSLKIINAEKTADLLQKAIDQFPGKIVPQDRDERFEVLSKIQKSAEDIWADLDLKFFKYDDDLNFLNMEFVRKHKNEF